MRAPRGSRPRSTRPGPPLPAWAARPLAERVEALKAWRDRVLDDACALGGTLVAESGKPRHEAEAFEILYLCELIRFASRAARRALAEETRNPFLFVTKKTLLKRTPLGVVGVIGPWNFPILNNAADAVGPLLTGNTVVLKPSELTPLTSLHLRDLWVQAGNPPDVFRVVTGRGEAGAELVARADGIMFTGSVCDRPQGRLESGRAPHPVRDRARRQVALRRPRGRGPRRAPPRLPPGRASSTADRSVSGPSASTSKRRSPTGSRSSSWIASGRCDRSSAGGGTSAHDLGAVTFEGQIAVVERQIADATAKGARVATGGTRPSESTGRFFPPTVLLGANHSMEVMREETFGPLVPVMRVRDAEEALRLANDSHLGLNATVFGPRRAAVAFARRLQSGQAIVNDALVNYFVVESPLGGWKSSGLGVRHGVESLRQWTRIEAITEGRPLLAPIERFVARKLAFPYDPRFLALLRRASRLLYRRGIAEKLRRPGKVTSS